MARDDDESPDLAELAEERYWAMRHRHPDPADPDHPEPETYGLEQEIA